MKSSLRAPAPLPTSPPIAVPKAAPVLGALSHRWLHALSIAVATALLALIGMTQLTTPAAQPVTAPATSFSADRAMQQLEVIASQSRAIGLPGHDATRDYLIQQLTAMGLQPETQTTTAVLRFEGADSFNAGTITNVIARIPGTGSSGAIAIDAHYDSGATGPGASDNGAGVAATLEALRALLAGPPLANDLIIVFSDGEEIGDLGSAAFNQEHPWANDVRLAINFEAQGSGGPVVLYATSEEDGWLTSQYIDVVPRPSAYSLLPEIVRALPGMRLACDLEDYLLNGSAGLGFVFADDTPAYHTARDSTAAIDRGSLQQEGENTLAVVQHFGNQDLSSLPRTSNAVYFNVLPGVVLHYGGTWIIRFAAFITLLTGAVVAVGVRRRVLTIRGLAVGAAALLIGTVITVALVMLLWAGIRMLNSDYQVLMAGTYQSRLYVLALSLAAIALMTGMYALLQRRVRTGNLVAGAVLAWTLLAWGVSLAAPGASYLVLWPLAFALLPLAWWVYRRGDASPDWTQTALLLIAMIPPFFLLPGAYYEIIALLNRMEFLATVTGGIPMLGLWTLLIAPFVGLYLWQLQTLAGSEGRRHWIAPAVIGAIALSLIVWGNATSGFDAAHPRPDHIAYELNADTGQARWVSIDNHLDNWTAQFFASDPATGTFEIGEGVDVPAFVAPTTAVPLTAPTVNVINDAVSGDARTVTFHLTSPRNAPLIEADISAQGPITSASIDGRPLDLSDYRQAGNGTLQFGYAGITSAGIEITMTVQSTAPISISIDETTYGLPDVPGLTISPRPADRMPATGLPFDATIIRKTVSI